MPSIFGYLWLHAKEQTWHFLVDILLGLQHLHRQGILHRDLSPVQQGWVTFRAAKAQQAFTCLPTVEPDAPRKPTNILLSCPDHGAPRALLSDFGTAQQFGEPPNSQHAAASRGYTGTVEYTAPELLFRASDVTFQNSWYLRRSRRTGVLREE